MDQSEKTELFSTHKIYRLFKNLDMINNSMYNIHDIDFQMPSESFDLGIVKSEWKVKV